MPAIPTRTLRVVVAIVLLLSVGGIFALRGGGGGGVDVFTEDLASAGIDPDSVPEQGERNGDTDADPSDPNTSAQSGDGDATSTVDTGAAAASDSPTGDATSTTGPIATPGSTSLATPTVSSDPGSVTSASTRSTQGNTTTTPAGNGATIADDAPIGPANPYIPVATTPVSPGPTSTTTPSVNPGTPAASTTVSTQSTPTQSTPTPSTGGWCQIEVRESDGVIRWNDEGRTAVFRLNDAWFHTPDPGASVVLIPDEVDTNDEYVLRLWGNGTDDVLCTFTGQTTTTPPTTNQNIVAAPATTAAPTTTTTTTIPQAVAFTALPAPIQIPSGPPQFGFAAGLWGDDRTNYWNNLNAVPGTGRLIAHEFKSFTKTVNTDLYRWHMQSGRDLLLTWNGTDAESILNGSQDDWIRHHAEELRSLPGTVKLRFWHEPDVNHKLAWIDNDPQQYIDSWMHVRRIFAEEQALNVEWVWCPTAWNWAERGSQFYPGDANVDWLCADGYSGWDLNAPLPDVQNAFTSFQAWANQRPNKPILIAEFGAGERGPGDRADWISGIPNWVQSSPNIRAVVYFDVDMRPNGEIYDWRIRTEPDAWDAMIDVITSAPFSP